MGLSLVVCALWTGIDAARAPITRVFVRWVATAVLISGGLGSGHEGTGEPAR